MKSVLALICGLFTIWALNKLFPLDLPSEQTLFAKVVVDINGDPLRAFPDQHGIWRYPVTLDEVSPIYLDTLIRYEDRRFWWHPGVDPLALLRAAYLNTRHGKLVSGGSTISMQVARLLHPHSRTLRGKLYQIARTFQLEWHLTKKDILTLYCNIAPFGGTIEGVQAASYSYLKKSAQDLTHAEAALLTVLPQSPTRLRPDLHPKRAEKARNKVLNRMHALGNLSSKTVESAKLEQVYAARIRPPLRAPLLSQRLASPSSRHIIQSTLQTDMQTALAETLVQFIEPLSPYISAAVMIVDNKTAEVRAYAGTAQFADLKRRGHIDMALAIRSPGSTLKPFVYGMALDERLIHSHSLLSDTPKQFNGYRPANFSGQFSGPVSAAEALQRSLNVPAVALLSRLSSKKVYDALMHAGMKLQLNQAKPNLSIVLGGIGTNLESLVAAYSSLARGGRVPNLRYTQDQIQKPERYLLSEDAAWIIYTLLKDVPVPDALPGVRSLASRPSLSWKTGTSYGHRDTWAIGLDAQFTVGVWVGRPDGTPIPGATGRDLAGRLLHALADQFDIGQHAIPKPNTVSKETICWPLGYASRTTKTDHCHTNHQAWTLQGATPPTLPEHGASTETNPLPIWVKHQQQTTWVSPRCKALNTSKALTQEQVALWPASMDAWLPRHRRRANLLPTPDPDCPPQYGFGSELTITSIKPDTIVSVPDQSRESPTLDLLTNAHIGIVHWYINGVFLKTATTNRTVQFELQKRGSNQIVAVDAFGRAAKAQVYWR